MNVRAIAGLGICMIGLGFAVDRAAAEVMSLPATAVEWSSSVGGNDHWYWSVQAPAGISWTDASTAAGAAGGHLATITSAAENQFIFDNVASDTTLWAWGDARYVGPWLGGYQDQAAPEFDGTADSAWRWVSGEAWSFATWSPGAPAIGFEQWGGARFLQYFNVAERAPLDVWNNRWDGLEGVPVVAYIVETNVPEPSTVAVALTFLLPALRRRRTRAPLPMPLCR